MARRAGPGLGALDAEHMLVRTVECVHGTIEVEAICEPAFDYATEEASWKLVDKDGLRRGRERRRRDAAAARGHPAASSTAGSPAACGRSRPASALPVPVLARGAQRAGRRRRRGPDCIQETVNLWRRWLERGHFPDHPWRWTLQRSALVLKGLTYEPTGGDGRRADHLAAGDARRRAQLGLPLHLDPGRELHPLEPPRDRLRPGGEGVHGVRLALCPAGAPRRRSCSGSGARRSSTEATLDHLTGYVGSKPVRVGNAAYNQRQNDVYGALLDSVYIHSKTREGVAGGDGCGSSSSRRRRRWGPGGLPTRGSGRHAASRSTTCRRS